MMASCAGTAAKTIIAAGQTKSKLGIVSDEKVSNGLVSLSHGFYGHV